MPGGLSVIVPTKTRSNAIPCLRAVGMNDPGCWRIVVDDGVDFPKPRWPDDTEGELDGIYEEVVKGVKPFVFSRACNQGIRAAGDTDVILLNDDALLKTPIGFTAMQLAAEKHPEYGIISSSCNNVGNPNQLPHLPPGGNPLVIRDEPRTVCFVCVLIPRRTINLVGLLDENFTGYGMEDDSYCLRVRRAGLKLGISNRCFVDHHLLKSTFRGPSPTNSAPGDFTGNMKIFISMYGVDNWGRDRDHSPYSYLFPPKKA
jgi:hypothetical protein